MTDQNITLTNNLVSGVAEDYKDMAGILSTYVTHAVVDHNEVQNLPYDGIDIGWGWGMNDAGGSNDYANRGTYNFQPRYTTPTTLKNTDASFNKIHATKKIFHDGGSLYNLSANPSATFNDNYIFDNHNTVGLYLDEGSRYVTLTNNVVQDSGVWAFTNANGNNNTNDNAFNSNWFNGGATQVATGSPHNNTLNGNVQVSGTNWPSGAQQVISQSGIQSGSSTGGGFPAGFHQFVVANDSLCLDVFGNTGTAGAAIDQYTCNGQSNQQFQFVPVSGGYGELQAQNSGQDVAVANSSTAQGTPDIVQQAVNGAANSLWLPQQQSDGSWQFKNQNSGLCLDVFGNGSNTGQQLDQWPCKNAPGTNQDFNTR